MDYLLQRSIVYVDVCTVANYHMNKSGHVFILRHDGILCVAVLNY